MNVEQNGSTEPHRLIQTAGYFLMSKPNEQNAADLYRSVKTFGFRSWDKATPLAIFEIAQTHLASPNKRLTPISPKNPDSAIQSLKQYTEGELGPWLTKEINTAIPTLKSLSDNPTVNLLGITVRRMVKGESHPGYQIETPKQSISLFPAPTGGYEYHIVPESVMTGTEEQGLSGTTKGKVSLEAAEALSLVLELLNSHHEAPIQ